MSVPRSPTSLLAGLDLGWKPAWTIEDGMEELLAWMERHPEGEPRDQRRDTETPGTGPSAGASIRVQTVLYRPAPGDIERLLRGLQHAVQVLHGASADTSVVMAFGDASPKPNLSIDQVDVLSSQMNHTGSSGSPMTTSERTSGRPGATTASSPRFKEDFVLFLNPDAYLSPFALAELMLLSGDATAGIVEARQIPLEHPKSFDPDSGDTSWASTAGALVRREVIEAIEGFDADSFFLYCDDVDFSWRARLAGYRVVHQPTAQIFHDKRLTTYATMHVGDPEHYYAAEAALMLAWKYSRPDLSEKWALEMEESTMELQRNAAAEFRKRAAEEADFPRRSIRRVRWPSSSGTDFAKHRFSYADA